MQSIELTEEHKTKLLEMCKVLFTELNLQMYYDDDIADTWEEARLDNQCGNDAQVQFLISNWHKPTAKIIHWFEFCLTDLQNELYRKLSKISKIGIDTWNHNLIGRIYFHKYTGNGTNGHPIDYLYDQFKRI